MNSKNPKHVVPTRGNYSPEGEAVEVIDMGKPTYHFPLPGKGTRLKFDKATGAWIIDPDQTPKADAPPPSPPAE